MIHPPLFQDLSDAEKGALLLAKHRGQKIEMYWPTSREWCVVDPAFNDLCAYRIALTPDTIDWSHLAPEWRFVARDDDNSPLLYQARPERNAVSWAAYEPCARVTTPSYRNNGMPWEQSLIERPENE